MTTPTITCYRHHDRRAGVTCQRCDRPICPDCMTQGSVGFHCPECVKAAAKTAPVYTARTLPVAQPLVTYALIAVSVGVFLLDLSLQNRISRGPGTGVLYPSAVAAGEWWRLVTSGFVHVSILQIAVNMFILYRLGPDLEKLLGHLRFLALYLASLLGGSLGALVLNSNVAAAGASGAYWGLLGAAAAYQLSNGINIWQSRLGPLILILGVTTLLGGSAFGAHIGGAVAGTAVGWAMFELERRGQPLLVGAVVGATVTIACAAVAIALAPSLIVYR